MYKNDDYTKSNRPRRRRRWGKMKTRIGKEEEEELSMCKALWKQNKRKQKTVSIYPNCTREKNGY